MKPHPFPIAAIVALAACNAVSEGPATPPEQGAETTLAQDQGTETQLAPADREIARVAIDALAEDLKIDKDAIVVESVTPVDWPDSSIGCPQPDRAYLTVITPGHKVVLRVNEQVYSVNEANGRAFICRQKSTSHSPAPGGQLAFGPQVKAAREDLAKRLNVRPDDIRVASASRQSWSDDSLGCPQPGTEYSKQEIAGWVLILRHGNRDYTYHADSTSAIPCPAITAE